MQKAGSAPAAGVTKQFCLRTFPVYIRSGHALSNSCACKPSSTIAMRHSRTIDLATALNKWSSGLVHLERLLFPGDWKRLGHVSHVPGNSAGASKRLWLTSTTITILGTIWFFVRQ